MRSSARASTGFGSYDSQGVENITGEAADRIAGEDAEFHRRDLFEAIARGENPKWTLSVQVMPYEEAKTYRFNPFDLTKTWPHTDYPLIEVGTMTLDENPVNFFAQIDQAAFAPSNTVPGIGFSPDKMLLGRVFAYADAHRARIGANFHQLPVNRPAVDQENHYTFDGPMRYEHSGAAPTYQPNSFGRPHADETGPADDGWEADGPMVRSAYELHAEDDDFGQPGTLVREVFSQAQRDRLVDTVVGTLGGVGDPVLSRVFEYWSDIDPETGRRIAEAKAAADEGSVDPGEVLREVDTHADG